MRSVLIAAGFGLIISILLTPLAIRAFRRQGLGQEIRDDGPESHLSKKGTPTMGGTVIVGATVGGYLAAHLFLSDQPGWGFTATGLLLLFLMVGMGTVGFLDDYLKIRHRRSLGPEQDRQAGRPAGRRRRLRGPGDQLPEQPTA